MSNYALERSVKSSQRARRRRAERFCACDGLTAARGPLNADVRYHMSNTVIHCKLSFHCAS